MGHINNPIAHLEKTRPQMTEKQKAKAKEQARIQARIDKFEAQRAQEDPMQMVDMNPGEHQSKMNRVTVPKRSADQLPPSPLAGVPMPRPAVQKVARTPEPVADSGPDIFKEMESEFAAPAQDAAPVAQQAEAPDDFDPQSILKRFKGTPEEMLNQLAKSYGSSEKRMRQLENEKKMLIAQGYTPQQAAQAVQQPVQPQPAPVQQQVQIQPQFDYKKWGDSLLDNPAERAQEFDQHIRKSLTAELTNTMIAPLFNKVLDLSLMQQFPDVVNSDNLDVIKAMAYKEAGEDRWEKLVSAATKYKAAMPNAIPTVNKEVEAMQQAAQQPAPQARVGSGDKKMWKASDLRKMMVKSDYLSDPSKRALVERAYAEGRVHRDQ